MRKIGEILVEKGALSVSELTAGLEATRRDGGKIGSQLVRLGFIDEHLLLDALSEQFRVPSVSAQMLLRAPAPIRRLLPTSVAAEMMAIPFMRREQNIMVAMANPSDLNVRRAIAIRLRCRIVPHVATEAAIVGALRDLAPDDPNLKADSSAGGAAGASESIEASIDFPTFLQRLEEVTQPNDVARLLYRLSRRVFHHPAVFAVSKGRVKGWLGARTGESANCVRDFQAPLDLPSVFIEASVSDGFSGVVPDSPVNRELVGMLGIEPDEQVEVLPVRLGGREVAFLFGVVARRGTGVTLAHLQDAVVRAGRALEELLLHRGPRD